MKKIFLFLFILLLKISFCYSQQNLLPGYIIDLSNDTINGYIDYRGDLYNSLNCVFFSQPGSEPRTFYPGEIAAYRFPSDKYYVSKTIKTETGDTTVFLEYLVNGITSLYYLKDKSGEHFFIERGNDLFELTNKISEVNYQNNLYQKESNIYKGILRYVYSGAEKMMPYINEAKFNRESMIKLSRQYHNIVCKDRECIIYENETPTIRFSVGPALKIERINTKYEGFLEPFSYEKTFTFFIGIASNLQLLSVNEKINLGISLFFGKDDKTGTFSKVYTDMSQNKYIKLHENKILLNFDVRYEYPKGKIRPSFSLGPQICMYVNQKTDYTLDTFEPDGSLRSEIQYFDFINHSFDLSGVGKIGLIHNGEKMDFFFDLYSMIGVGFFREKGGVIERWDKIRESRLSSFGIMTGILF